MQEVFLLQLVILMVVKWCHLSQNLIIHPGVCVSLSVCARVPARCVCMRACLCLCVCARVSMCLCVCVCVCLSGLHLGGREALAPRQAPAPLNFMQTFTDTPKTTVILNEVHVCVGGGCSGHSRLS